VEEHPMWKAQLVRMAGVLGVLGWFGFGCLVVNAQEINDVRVDKRVLVLQMGPWFDTMTVIDAGKSLVVVDTWASHIAAARAKEIIDKTFGKPVSHVINTHYHWDHTFGNQVFEGATIIGHELCREDMETEYGKLEGRLKAIRTIIDGADPETEQYSHFSLILEQLEDGHRLVVPDHLVGDSEEITIDKLTFKLYHVPGLHTRSNLTIHVQELGLVFTRHNFHHTQLPRLETGVEMDKLIGSLEDILSCRKPVKHILVGHGSPLSDPKLEVALAYLEELQRAVTTARAKSMTPEACAAMVEVADNHKEQHLNNVLILWR
jgi:glyoxylase-like metal-dependent hydrolase (beta-lactamase superfamily II)